MPHCRSGVSRDPGARNAIVAAAQATLGRGLRRSYNGTISGAPYASAPWQCLNFLPLPQGQGSLRPTRLNSSP